MTHMDSGEYDCITFDVFVSDGEEWRKLRTDPQRLDRSERLRAAIELLGLEVRVVPHHSDDQIPCLG